MHFYGQVRNVGYEIWPEYGAESGFEFDCVSALYGVWSMRYEI